MGAGGSWPWGREQVTQGWCKSWHDRPTDVPRQEYPPFATTADVQCTAPCRQQRFTIADYRRSDRGTYSF